ncbi:hypothetical protein A2Z22_05185 [Candidatus Woesebacteria bacterium RBG_16_34_12]|uniref:histidine kinase n=1 Tax=Candidatus Woesebacteria bacterium RBG_16_34_12 TaxID=1802480 RepID=A0A1F7XB52_9BACT|nr:MAG: hypothetical protein A2Z22_05185 [Candidatus Woesebacteria bacterium RBG_16_34_12]
MLDYLLSIIIWVGIIGNVILGILVYNRDSVSIINKLFVGLALSASAWAVSLYFFEHPIFFDSEIWLRITYLTVLVIINVFLQFSFIFPKRINKTMKIPLLTCGVSAIIFVYFIIFTDLFVANVVKESWGYHQTLGLIYPVFGIWAFLYSFWAVLNFFKSYRISQGFEKLQMQYLFLGMFFYAVIPLILDIVFPVFLKDSRFIWFSPVSASFFTAFIAISIMKHRLLGIRLILARSLAYTFLLLTFTIIYIIGILFLGSIFTKQSLSIYNILISIILALFISFSFQSLKKFFEMITDKIFYKDKYETDELLHEISQILVATIDLDNLTSGVLGILKENVHFVKGAVFILDENRNIDQVYIDKSRKYLFPTNDELKVLAKSHRFLIFEEMDEGREKEVMRRKELSLFIPLETKEKLVGYLIIGEKSSGDIYYKQDLSVFEILAPEFAVALTNAESFTKIQEFSKILEKKVKERTKELKETQKRELKKAKELLKLKDEFVFIASHELRTPVTAIDGYVGLIDRSKIKFDQDTKENFQAIEKANERLNQLVDDLLDVSRSESGTLKVSVNPVNLNQVITATLGRVKSLTDKKKVSVTLNLDSGNFLVLSDTEKLSDVMENLLSNAIKYNKPGGEIKISSERKDDCVQVDVKDTGFGIPKKLQDKVFSRFFRAKVPGTETEEGTGLGLFITKMLIEKMHGKMTFVSEEGKGSVFSFILPLAN